MANIDDTISGVKQIAKKISDSSKKDKTIGREDSKRQFKKDVKYSKKMGGLEADFVYDPKTNIMETTQWYNSKNQKIGQDYAMRVLAEVGRQRMSKNR